MGSDAVTVLLFARYRDLLGAPTISVPRAQAQTVGAVVSYLRSLPGGAALPEIPLVAVNMRRVGLDHRVEPADEVALLPPMAGG